MKAADMDVKQEVQAQDQGSEAWPRVAIVVLNWSGLEAMIDSLDAVS
jgi:hypothetical protein